MATATKKTKPIIPHLLPLEYCSPERAAKLLGCEIDDIFHWVATGAIELLAEFNYYKIDTEHAELINDTEFHESFSNEHGVNYSFYGPREHGEKNYSPCIHRFEPDDKSKVPEVFISGLWHLDYEIDSLTHVQSRLKEDSRCNLTALFEEYNKDVDFIPMLTLYDVLVSAMPDRLRIMRDDLLKMQESIISGEVMKVKTRKPFSEKKKSSTNDSTHPTAERMATVREVVWAAAIYAREQWPNGCNTATDWASTIVDHSHKLFGADKAPLSHDTMTRMLSKAMNEGTPYKKS